MTESQTLGQQQREQAVALRGGGQPPCPICGGRMWDNRARKTYPKAPDFKCRTLACTGRIWPGQLESEETTHEAIAADDAPVVTPTGTGQPGPLADAVRSVVEAVSARTRCARVRSELRACYLDVTDFVLAEVRPRYAAAGVPCGDATIAAVTATLFIATCNCGAVGPEVDESTSTPGPAA
jgi:hypothetical protein